jgi:predicted transcriptional regulator
MPTVKTAISLQESLFKRVDQLARELDIPRSHVFVLAVEEFIQRYENRKLLKTINEAY